jgi:hypothetical protein
MSRRYSRRSPAAILLYTLAPKLLLGWPRANRLAERNSFCAVRRQACRSRHHCFYHAGPSDAQIERVLAGRD